MMSFLGGSPRICMRRNLFDGTPEVIRRVENKVFLMAFYDAIATCLPSAEMDICTHMKTNSWLLPHTDCDLLGMVTRSLTQATLSGTVSKHPDLGYYIPNRSVQVLNDDLFYNIVLIITEDQGSIGTNKAFMRLCLWFYFESPMCFEIQPWATVWQKVFLDNDISPSLERGMLEGYLIMKSFTYVGIDGTEDIVYNHVHVKYTRLTPEEVEYDGPDVATITCFHFGVNEQEERGGRNCN